jgi:repressor LexA
MYLLTPRQHAIVTFISNYTTKHGYAPSYREIRDHCNLASVGTVYKHIHKLVEKGALKLSKGQARHIIATEANEDDIDSTKAFMLPLVGNIKAGSPLEMLAIPQQVALPTSMVTDSQITYLLRVSDDSLQEELIARGDLIIVEARPPADKGETIIGIVNGCDVLIKRYYHADNLVRLEGQNAQHTPMVLHNSYLEILGVVKGSLRTYTIDEALTTVEGENFHQSN